MSFEQVSVSVLWYRNRRNRECPITDLSFFINTKKSAQRSNCFPVKPSGSAVSLKLDFCFIKCHFCRFPASVPRKHIPPVFLIPTRFVAEALNVADLRLKRY